MQTYAVVFTMAFVSTLKSVIKDIRQRPSKSEASSQDLKPSASVDIPSLSPIAVDMSQLSSPRSISYMDTAFLDDVIEIVNQGNEPDSLEEQKSQPMAIEYDTVVMDGVLHGTDYESNDDYKSEPPQPTYRKLSDPTGFKIPDELSFIPKQNILQDITDIFTVGMLIPSLCLFLSLFIFGAVMIGDFLIFTEKTLGTGANGADAHGCLYRPL